MPKISVKPNLNIDASPMNYIGGKAKLLPQLLPHFPDKIDTFYDVFAGGGNVCVNANANKVVINDLNHYVIDILEKFYTNDTDSLLKQIHAYIDEYGLSKSNKEAFVQFRKDYNAKPNPVMLYTLICYSFNYQFRFNNNHEYNNPFGKDRSHFSPALENKLIRFSSKLKSISATFSRSKFDELIRGTTYNRNDFVYLDPPYLITTGSYNDGNRGFKNWTPKQESLLFETLDWLNSNKVKFALSNVVEHKGRTNPLLDEWLSNSNYKVIPMNYCYRNCSHNTARKSSKEVLIINY